MAKIHSYYISNAKNQFQYYGNLLSNDEIQDQVIFATQNLTDLQEITNEDEFEAILLEDEDIVKPELAKELVEEEELRRILAIEVCVNLSNQMFVDNKIQVDSEINDFFDDMEDNNNNNTDFNVEDLINQALDSDD